MNKKINSVADNCFDYWYVPLL